LRISSYFVEEVGVLATLVFLLPGILVSIGVFIVTSGDTDEALDWSFIIFFLGVILSLIDLICSIVRAVRIVKKNKK
jgi:uncharacterized membrane protein YjjB (DUF3815 family)